MATPFSIETRQAALAETALYDVLVVGGGITGAGIAWEAALRGLSVLLVERGDFASGTSSKSSKLLHGGLRYLEHGEIHLVFESLAQRNHLFHDAPHLARKLDFMIPIFEGGKDKGWMVGCGLTGYDLLSTISDRKETRWHKRLSVRATRAAEPLVRARGLKASYRYTDGVTEDARLVIETIKSAVAAGARVLSYAEVTEFIKDAEGRMAGVSVRDRLDGATHRFRARRVVNAAGPWVDALCRLDDPRASRRLRPTKGIHVLTRAFVSDHAVVMRSQGKGEPKPRVVYVIPWNGRTLIGTTDTDPAGDPEDLSYLDQDLEATPDEVRYVLDAVNGTFDVALGPDDVIAAFAGWRPLIAPDQPGLAASDVSREHAIFESASGLVSIAGGKLTAYRAMAREAVERVVASLGADAPAVGPSRVDRMPLSGAVPHEQAGLAAHVEAAVAAAPALPAGLVRTLAARYGANWSGLAALLAERPELAAPLPLPDQSYYAVEVHHAVRYEGALTLSDFLMRRTRLYLLAEDQATGVAPLVAKEMAAALAGLAGWPPQRADAWAEAELGRYREAVAVARAARTPGTEHAAG